MLLKQVHMIKISNGNKKIGNDTLIFNMCSATDCPSKKYGLCDIDDNKCYAMKAERQYPAVLPYRRQQQRYWEETEAKDIAIDLVGIINRKRNPIKYIRFSEAGDFDAQYDVNKMAEIVSCMDNELPEVTWYGYTARKDLDFSNIPHSMVVNGSGFMVSNMFTALKDMATAEIQCPGDCRECDLCKGQNGLDIKVRYH